MTELVVTRHLEHIPGISLRNPSEETLRECLSAVAAIAGATPEEINSFATTIKAEYEIFGKHAWNSQNWAVREDTPSWQKNLVCATSHTNAEVMIIQRSNSLEDMAKEFTLAPVKQLVQCNFACLLPRLTDCDDAVFPVRPLYEFLFDLFSTVSWPGESFGAYLTDSFDNRRQAEFRSAFKNPKHSQILGHWTQIFLDLGTPADNASSASVTKTLDHRLCGRLTEAIQMEDTGADSHFAMALGFWTLDTHELEDSKVTAVCDDIERLLITHFDRNRLQEEVHLWTKMTHV